jgi:molybdate-binding protein
MNDKDRETVAEAMKQLFGKTGDEYRDASRAEWGVRDRVRVAEQEIQARFRPHWNKLMAIIRRECKARGVRFTANHSGYQGVEYVRIDKEPSAVGINHIDYTVNPYIHLEFWLGYGMKIEWSGYAKTTEDFVRKFAVLLATIDGYLSKAKSHGKDCETCHLARKDVGRCERCEACNDGSMWF